MTGSRPDVASVRVRTLPTQVAAHLIRRIAEGAVVEGNAPSELDITQEFGVSRVVARETLKILASLDIVEIVQGRRVTIRPAAEWDYLSPLLMQWLPPKHVEELLAELNETRRLLEPELAAKAASPTTDSALARLRTLLDQMALQEDDPDQYLQTDLEFHMEICRAANNRVLERIMYSARWLLTVSRQVTNEVPGGLHEATEHHRRIYAAIEASDPHGARAAMRAHLEKNRVALVEERGGTPSTTARTSTAAAAPKDEGRPGPQKGRR